MKSVIAVMFLSLMSAIIAVFAGTELSTMEQYTPPARRAAASGANKPEPGQPSQRREDALPLPIVMPNPLRMQ
ncbi:MAG: hypothetical protein RLZ81_1114 [Pseudomonadota bacterium]